MDKAFEVLRLKFNNLLKSEYLSFDDVAALRNIMGVYLIYDEERKLIYIGSTNKFHIRFGTDLKHETTHTLVKKLIKEGIHADRYKVLNYLKSKCFIRIEQCDSKREAEALEHIAIYFLNPQLNK